MNGDLSASYYFFIFEEAGETNPVEGVELLDNDNAFLLDNDGAYLIDNE
jgi:hypothetical protein